MSGGTRGRGNGPNNTQINVKVQVERADEYVGKRGLVKNQVITCQDMDPSGVRLLNTFDYTLTPEEKDKYAGKLMDKDVTLQPWSSGDDPPGNGYQPPTFFDFEDGR